MVINALKAGYMFLGGIKNCGHCGPLDSLGGGNSNVFLNFDPENWGNEPNFTSIVFTGVGSTTMHLEDHPR